MRRMGWRRREDLAFPIGVSRGTLTELLAPVKR
jgi:hypothetical protein